MTIELFIGGQRVPGVSTSPVAHRWTGAHLADVAVADASHARAAVDAAAAALRAGMPVHQRVQVLHAVADGLSARAEEAAELITAEMGKPIGFSRVEVQRAISVFRLSAEEAMRLPAEAMNLEGSAAAEGVVAFTLPRPLGIVAAITPFNFPANLVAHKIGPAIAAGCPVVLKPSDKGRLIANLITELFIEAGIPSGFLNLVTGQAATIVTEWLQDDRVIAINFTGSSAVGWHLKAQSPKKHHILELGSNTALIVNHDANVVEAAKTAAMSAMANSGQACISLQRIYVHESILDKFADTIAAEVKAMQVGDPTDEATFVGPLVSDKDVDRLESWIADAVEHGGEILTGGRISEKVLAPTVIKHPGKGARLLRDEAFGPVVLLVPFAAIEEAIEEVNSADYGLNASIFTNSVSEALDFARHVEAGAALVNLPPSWRSDQMPYGGVKDSGQGREGVRFAVAEMLQQKLVLLKNAF